MREGAILGMISGISVTLFYVFQHKGVMFISDRTYLESWGQRWFFGIEPNAFGVVGAIVNFSVAKLVSLYTAEPPQEIQALVEEIRVPAGAGAAVEH